MDVQLPGGVTQLGTGLADMDVADLEKETSQTQAIALLYSLFRQSNGTIRMGQGWDETRMEMEMAVRGKHTSPRMVEAVESDGGQRGVTQGDGRITG